MEKKVGNYFFEQANALLSNTFLLLLLVSTFVAASESSIILRIQDMNHESIKQAMVKAPFILQVELKNLEGYTDVHLMKYIPGIENFKSSQSITSHNVSVEDGKKTVKTFYNFVLRADKKGNFTLGPIALKDRTGKLIQSKRFVIPVGDEVISTEKVQKDKYFMTVDLDKKEAYIGEKIGLIIKFYDRVFVDDLHLQFPEFKNMFIAKKHNNIKQSMIEIEGEEYSVTEWNFEVYGTEIGSLILQDIHAAFFAPNLENKFSLGGAFDFFRVLHKSEQYIVGKPTKVEILPLPLCSESCEVAAVGQCTQFKISLNQNSVPVGQGIVLTAELYGDLNFEMMPVLQLSLPQGFKYYDSNMVTINSQRDCKRIEFIVQADLPGDYIIKPQLLLYFDPADQQYKKIVSNEVAVTVTPALQKVQQDQIIDKNLYAEDMQETNITRQLDDFTIIKANTICGRMISGFPYSWYQSLLTLLFLVWLLLAVWRYIVQKYIFQHFVWKKYIIFFQARRMCRLAIKKFSVTQLQQVFEQLFANLLGITLGQLHNEVIIEYLQAKHFSDQEIIAWKHFYQQLLQASFSLQDQKDEQLLFSQAEAWIERLKEKV